MAAGQVGMNHNICYFYTSWAVFVSPVPEILCQKCIRNIQQQKNITLSTEYKCYFKTVTPNTQNAWNSVQDFHRNVLPN